MPGAHLDRSARILGGGIRNAVAVALAVAVVVVLDLSTGSGPSRFPVGAPAALPARVLAPATSQPLAVPRTSPLPALTGAGASAPTAVLPAVTVLNDSRYRGLATRVVTLVRAAGYTDLAAGNLHARVAATTVYYLPGAAEAASRLATAVAPRLGRTARVLPVPQWLPRSFAHDGGLLLVVTRDLEPGI